MKKKYNYFQIVTAMVFVFSFIFLIYNLNAYIDHYVNFDDSSELVLARILADEHSVLSANWYYSTEIRFINTNLIYPIMFYFTNNWHMVRILSYVAMYIIMLISYYFFCKEYSLIEYYFITATLLITPFSDLYFTYVLRGGYYIPHITISFIFLTLLEKYIKNKSKVKAIVLTILSFIFSVMVGMGGPRQPIILFVPLFFSVLYRVLLDNKDIFILSERTTEKNYFKRFASIEKNELKALFYSFFILGGSIVGYIINTRFLINVYTFQIWDDFSYCLLDAENIQNIANGFLSSYGYSCGVFFKSSMIDNGICIFIISLLIASVNFAKKNKNKIDGNYKRLADYTCVAFTIFILIYVFSNLSYHDRYNLPIIIFAFPLIGMFIKEINIPLVVKKAVLLSFLLVYIFNCILYYKQFSKMNPNVEIAEITSLLLNKGYSEGYCSFWNGNVITELSNGNIDVWMFEEDADDIEELKSFSEDILFNNLQWLQDKRHDYSYPLDHFFVVLSRNRYNKYAKEYSFTDDFINQCIIYESENFVVLGCDNIEQL